MEGFLDKLGIDRFYMYVFDYGAPIGFRIAVKHPERILGLVSQNGNVYEEGLGKKWEARAEYTGRIPRRNSGSNTRALLRRIL